MTHGCSLHPIRVILGRVIEAIDQEAEKEKAAAQSKLTGRGRVSVTRADVVQTLISEALEARSKARHR